MLVLDESYYQAVAETVYIWAWMIYLIVGVNFGISPILGEKITTWIIITMRCNAITGHIPCHIHEMANHTNVIKRFDYRVAVCVHVSSIA